MKEATLKTLATKAIEKTDDNRLYGLKVIKKLLDKDEFIISGTYVKREDLLKFIVARDLIKVTNDEERKLIKDLVNQSGAGDKNSHECVIFCKHCKKRYRTFTDGAWITCKCHELQWKSNGNMLQLKGKKNGFNIFTLNPDYLNSNE